MNLPSCGLFHSSGPQTGNEREQKERRILGPCWRTKKFWNMNVTMIQVVDNGLGTVPKDLERELEELEIRRIIKTIQTTAFFRLLRVLKRILET